MTLLKKVQNSAFYQLFQCSHRRKENSARNDRDYTNLIEYNTLMHCEFIAERLTDWASADIGRDAANDEMIVIPSGEQPIHANYPQILAAEAQNALQHLKCILEEIQNTKPTVTVKSNPFLPFITAIASGYFLLDNCILTLAQVLVESVGQHEIEEILQQLGQLLNILTPVLECEDRTQIAGFITFVAKHAHIDAEKLLMCMEELK